MAPRADWKGFLRLSLVTCPVALYPATSDSDKISFNQLNKNTDHRIKYTKVDADTGEEVANEDIVKGYKLDTDNYIEVSNEELEELAPESTRTIEIDEFVERDEIDPRHLIRPYYLRPDGKIGHDAFAVIRETIRDMNKVAIGELCSPTASTSFRSNLWRRVSSERCCATRMRFAQRRSISRTSKTSKSPRICSTSPSTS
jgi:DNA end-binding protein Ku